jgi:CDP-4-dehydro-6-deoxyglucose reductase, E1
LYKIPLIKSAFYKENETLEKLSSFIHDLCFKDKKQLSMGELCKQFELKFAEWQKRKYAVLVNSGASANLLLLQSLKNLGFLKQGNNIGFSALTWATNVMPIIQMGFNPIPIDCESSTLNIDIWDLKEKIKDIDCLFITNALGLCSDLLKIKHLCSQNNVLLLEDNAESQGTEFQDIKLGNFGLASTFSFFVGHIMSTIEGGMICTDNEELYNSLLMTRANGWDRNLLKSYQNRLRNQNKINNFQAKYTFYDLAFNVRPTEITGFLGLEQLKYIDEIIDKRQDNFNHFMMIYLENNNFIPIDNLIELNKIASFAFPVICRNNKLRNKYLQIFEKVEIETRPMIAGDITQQPFWKKYIKQEYNLEGVKFLDKCSFYIGNNPYLTQEDMNIIMECIR